MFLWGPFYPGSGSGFVWSSPRLPLDCCLTSFPLLYLMLLLCQCKATSPPRLLSRDCLFMFVYVLIMLLIKRCVMIRLRILLFTLALIIPLCSCASSRDSLRVSYSNFNACSLELHVFHSSMDDTSSFNSFKQIPIAFISVPGFNSHTFIFELSPPFDAFRLRFMFPDSSYTSFSDTFILHSPVQHRSPFNVLIELLSLPSKPNLK